MYFTWLRSLALIFVLISCLAVDATSRYWMGTSGGSWSTATNWCTNSANSCGSCGYSTGAPVTGDDVIFNSACTNNSVMGSDLSVGYFKMDTGYTGTVTLNANLTCTGGASFEVKAGTFVQNGTITYSGTHGFTVSGGTFTGGNEDINISGVATFTHSGGSFTSTSGTFTSSGNAVFDTSGTFNHNNGTILFKKNIDLNRAVVFNHVRMDSSPGWFPVYLGNRDLIIRGNFTAVGGNGIFFYEHSGYKVYVQGDLDVSGFSAGSSFDANFGFNGAAATQLYKDTTSTTKLTKALTINKSSGIVNLGFNWTVDSDGVTVTSGALDFNGNTITNANYITVQAGGTLQLRGDESVTGTIVFNDNSHVKYDGTSGPYTIKNWAEFTDADTVEVDLTIAGGSTTVFTLPAAFNDVNDLTISSGIFSLGSYNLTMDGTFSNDGTFRQRGSETISGLTQDTNSGTWEYVGDGDSAADSYNVANFGTTDYYNLKISSTDAGDTYTASAISLAVNGSFTLSEGTFTAPTSGNDFFVTGNFTRSGGTYTANTGTITLDGTSQTITGSTTFYNFNKTVTATDTLTFAASSTTTVTNVLTLDGGASCSSLLLLRPASGTATITESGTENVTAVDIQDVTAGNSTTVTGNYRQAGTVTNWDFTGATDCDAAAYPRRLILGALPKPSPFALRAGLL